MSDVWIMVPDAAGNCCECSQRVTPCDPCSIITGSCCYTLPSDTSAYANITVAQSALDNYTAGCVVFRTNPLGPIPSSFSATETVDTITLSEVVPSNGGAPETAGDTVRLKFHGGSGTFDLNYAMTGPGLGTYNASFVLYSEDGTHIQTVSAPATTGPTSGTLHFTFAIPIVGYIDFGWSILNATPFSNGTYVGSVVRSGISFCNIRAAYTSGADTLYLYQVDCPVCVPYCPLQIPITGGDGTDFVYGCYANLTAAQTAIDTLTSNCIAFASNSCGVTAFSFTADNSTPNTLQINGQTTTNGGCVGVHIYSSLYLLDGSTLVISWNGASVLGTFFSIGLCLDGTFVDYRSSSGAAGTTSFIIDGTNNYLLNVVVDGSVGVSFNYSVTVTSDHSLIVNSPLLARSAIVGGCSAQLQCTP